jgi:hypothetical protein
LCVASHSLHHRRIDAARAGRAPYNQPVHSRIAYTTIMVI